ncbi:unnamed protein product [Linum tenue]|uniref:NB-ARC domain-containing protein n=1 Tax=Linum tenue TaxID=586396 RepID=A0AAV0NT29_9ROSI|nr:unnamed protein product [Linum tenue]
MQTVPIYNLKGLSCDDSWFLFVRHASRGGSATLHPNLEPVGKEIVGKCRGLPLAAKTLGGLMRSKKDAVDWERICKSNLWDLSNDEILPALYLSYHYLPSHLKRCFAYCAIFPKDYDFEKDELVYLWMAEGFIEQQSRGNKLMEELGDEYFNDLVSRSFFQRSSVDPTGYVMHDLINDLAKYVSSEFCFRLDCEDSCKISKRLRVLSLSHLRTLTELPDSIGHLKHLRYLNLSATAIQYLPATLCGVYNMQTLILHQCRELVQLPNNLGRLINLRHLDDALEANLKVKKYLKQLNFMWDGDTHDSVHERTVLEQLQPHTNIQSLSIVGYRGTRFPDWVGNSAFSSIVALKLSGGQHCNTLPPLGQLVSLSDLSIAAYVSVETIGYEFYGSCTSKWKPFGSLKSLRFESMLSWCEWIPFDGEAFPVLEKLYFRHCPNLKKALPSHLPSLSLLEVEGCQQLGVSLPRAPNICKIKFKDDTRDVQLVKLPSERHTLMIDRFNSVDTLLEAMEQMGGFSSTMERIEIRNCSSLRSFPLELFPGLKALILTRCLNLETLSASEVTGSNFPCLTCLEIRECPKLFSSLQETMPAPNLTRLLLMGCLGVESFPGKRLLPSTLTILKIWDFPSLTSLDWEGLQNLHSLRELQICNCPNLKCLPEEGFPLNLSHLYVSWCPLLEQRCRPDDGEDWPKIAHIPELEINFQKITTLEPSA